MIELELILKEGESQFTEFKEKMSDLAKTITAFAETVFRQNPMISDLFSRIEMGERLGTGLKRIKDECRNASAPMPAIRAKDRYFYITFTPSREYKKLAGPGSETGGVEKVVRKGGKKKGVEKGVEKGGAKPGLSWDQVGTMLGLSRYEAEKLFKFCIYPKSAAEAMKIFGRTNRTKFKDKYIKPMVEKGLLEMTSPDKPKSSTQKYFTSVLAKELLEKTLYDKRGGK